MSSVALRDFLYQLLICSEKAACIARHIRLMHADFDTIIQEKQLDENHQHLDADYKTLADVIIQEVIKRDLRRVYPSLDNRVYGEEDGSLKLHSSDEKIIIDVNGNFNEILTLLKKLFDHGSTQSIEALAQLVSDASTMKISDQDRQSIECIPVDQQVDLSTLGIWIDPIDGTQQYINGGDGVIDSITGINQDGLPTAMVLIGCFDVNTKEAVVGVINRAFDHKSDPHQSAWQGSIYWGIALPQAKYNSLKHSSSSHNKRVLIHGTVNSNTFQNILPDWTKREIAACGNKLLAVALKQANVFLVTKSAAYLWDLCAADAIIRSIDGHIVDLRRTLDYYKQHSTLDQIDLSQFTITYYRISSTNTFLPTDYACPPFIAFYQREDLIEVLRDLSSSPDLTE